MPDPRSTPGTYTPFGIVLMDEPESVSVTTFGSDGSVLLTLNARPGGNVSQLMLGLSPAQVLGLIERLQAHDDICRLAVTRGRGGARFKSP